MTTTKTFNVGKYNPADDSSDDHYALRLKHEITDGVVIDQRLVSPSVGSDEAWLPCLCGCRRTSPTINAGKSKFIQGHDAKFKGVLLRAHLAGAVVTTVGLTGVDVDSALDVAKSLGWVHYLSDAQKRHRVAAAARGERDKTKALRVKARSAEKASLVASAEKAVAKKAPAKKAPAKKAPAEPARVKRAYNRKASPAA